jgi:hypothetical protein
MALHILGIEQDPDPERGSSPTTETSPHQFWASAGDILIHIANARPSLGEAVQATIAAGGDIEIAAHNEPGRISLTLVERSGARRLLFDNTQPLAAYQDSSIMELRKIFGAMQSEHEQHCERLRAELSKLKSGSSAAGPGSDGL